MVARLAVRHNNSLLRSTLFYSRHTSVSPPTSRISQRRCEHTVPPIGQHNDTILEHGVPDLHTTASVHEAWTKYMHHILGRLNHIVAGDVRESMGLKELLIDVARNPASANLFNYASMAHNTHFYFSSLSPSPKPIPIPDPLQKHLTRSFSSISTLHTTFLSTAAAMFGPGFVWLVAIRNPSPFHPNTDPAVDDPKNRKLQYGCRTATPQNTAWDFRILTTYIAGSPYPGAHARQQSRDLNTQNVASVKDAEMGSGTAGSFGKYSPAAQAETGNARFGGADVVPLLCVNTWEHNWMRDFGVDGKRRFLESWWERIDWEEVWRRAVVMVAGGGEENRQWVKSGKRKMY